MGNFLIQIEILTPSLADRIVGCEQRPDLRVAQKLSPSGSATAHELSLDWHRRLVSNSSSILPQN
jgi:hypothetical protein